jgi:hypothetical protein
MPKLRKEVRNKALEMINEEYLDAEISEKLGINRQTVSKIRAEVKAKQKEISSPVVRTPWPKNVYDLMGISDFPTPEKAMEKAFEIYRRLYHYMMKYQVKSPEEVLPLLEGEITKLAGENTKLKADVTSLNNRVTTLERDPISIFEGMRDRTAVILYNDLVKKKGITKTSEPS